RLRARHRLGRRALRPPVAVPARSRILTADDARRFVARRGFDPPAGGPARGRRLGIEVEWLAVDLDADYHRAPLAALRGAVERCGPLPAGSRVTFEPGGQVELSTPPLPDLDSCEALAADAAALGNAFADAGVGLVALGLDPGAEPPRAVQSPRYDAMEAYF